MDFNLTAGLEDLFMGLRQKLLRLWNNKLDLIFFPTSETSKITSYEYKQSSNSCEAKISAFASFSFRQFIQKLLGHNSLIGKN